MKLFLARHSYAGARRATDGANDARSLTPEGREFTQAIVDKLEDRSERPLVIYTSPIRRCVETSQILADGFKNKPKVVVAKQLSREQKAGDVVEWLWDEILGPLVKRAMLVTHSELLQPVLAKLNDVKQTEIDPFVMGEMRRYKMDTTNGYWMERYRIQPSDVGPFDNYM